MRDYSYTQWRNSAKEPRVGLGLTSIDGRAMIGILPLLFHLATWTFLIFFFMVILFSVLEYFGYKFPVAKRKARSLLAGKYRFVRKSKERRKRLIHN